MSKKIFSSLQIGGSELVPHVNEHLNGGLWQEGSAAGGQLPSTGKVDFHSVLLSHVDPIQMA